jgi:chitinase
MPQRTGQTTIEWTLPVNANNGNVTLQAAALTAPSANNPPFALLTHPTNDATFAAPANIVLDAFAEDFDGTVTNVAFYANSNQLNQAADPPYSFTWNNAPIGYHRLTAVATDDRGATRSSVPVEIFVHGTNGSQTGAFALRLPQLI